jgi:hypothetical protein
MGRKADVHSISPARAKELALVMGRYAGGVDGWNWRIVEVLSDGIPDRTIEGGKYSRVRAGVYATTIATARLLPLRDPDRPECLSR